MPSSLAHQGRRAGGEPGADGREGEGRGGEGKVVDTHCMQVRFTCYPVIVSAVQWNSAQLLLQM